jgi:hypothetical protein
MANNCSNYISITGSSKEIKKLAKEITKEDAYLILCSKYGKSENDPRWFTFDNVEVYEAHITISGDSAWCPALDLFTNISKKYPSIEIEYEYEEGGCDFAGTATISQGACTDNCQTYWKGKVEIDYDYALQCAFESLDGFESEEELMESDMILAFKEDDQEELLKTYKTCIV